MTKTRDEVVEIIRDGFSGLTSQWDKHTQLAYAEGTYDALITAGVIPQWRPIEEAPLKVPKGFIRAYSYKPSNMHGRNPLGRVTNFEPHYGARVCDMFMDIPTPPQNNRGE